MTKKEYILAHYHDMTNHEIMDAMHIHVSYINKLAKEYNLTRSEETIQRHKKQCVEYHSRNCMRSIKYDRMLMLSGQKPKGNRVLSLLNMPSQRARRGLKYRRGYIYDKDDERLLYYDSNTKRSREDYFAEKYHFRFMPID